MTKKERAELVKQALEKMDGLSSKMSKIGLLWVNGDGLEGFAKFSELTKEVRDALEIAAVTFFEEKIV